MESDCKDKYDEREMLLNRNWIQLPLEGSKPEAPATLLNHTSPTRRALLMKSETEEELKRE